MVDKVKVIGVVVAVIVLTGVSVFAISVFGGEPVVEEETTDALPENVEFDENAPVETQVEAVLTDLYHKNHSQSISASFGELNRDSAQQTVQSEVQVSHEEKVIFRGTETDFGDNIDVLYAIATEHSAFEAVGVPGQSLTTPPESGWEEQEGAYSAESVEIPVQTTDRWSVIEESDETIVFGVEGSAAYTDVWGDSVRFSEVSNESYTQIHVDTATGEITRFVDYQVGMVEDDDGTVTGPYEFEREIVFEFGNVEIDIPDELQN